MAHQVVLQEGEVGMKYFNKEISYLKEYCKCCEGYLVDDIAIIKVTIRFFIDKSEYLKPTPARFEYIHKIKSISYNRANQNIDSKENNKNLHLFHMPFILEMFILPL